MAGVTEMGYLHFLLSIFVGRLLRFLILGVLVIAYGPEILSFLITAFHHHRGATFAVIAAIVAAIVLAVRLYQLAHRPRGDGRRSIRLIRHSSPRSLPIRIIGAGLAGPEAAWQCARRGIAVDLYEMRPLRNTPAHETDLLRRTCLLQLAQKR